MFLILKRDDVAGYFTIVGEPFDTRELATKETARIRKFNVEHYGRSFCEEYLIIEDDNK